MIYFVNRIIALGLILIFNQVIFSFAQSTQTDNRVTNQTTKNIQLIKNRGLSIEACRRIGYDYLNSEANKTKSIPYLEFVLDAFLRVT